MCSSMMMTWLKVGGSQERKPATYKEGMGSNTERSWDAGGQHNKGPLEERMMEEKREREKKAGVKGTAGEEGKKLRVCIKCMWIYTLCVQVHI